MRSPATLLTNAFQTGAHISDDHLRRYSVAHIERLSADGRFSDLTADTLVAHEAYFGATNLEAVKLGVQRSATRAMNEEFEQFKELASQYEGGPRLLWGKGTPEYLAFYPHGITEYRQATLTTVEEKIATYEAAIRAREEELPPEMVEAFLAPVTEGSLGGVIPRFRAARAAQQRALADTNTSKREAKVSRGALELQLWRNMLAVGLKLAGEPETERREAMRLFPVHWLSPAAKRSRNEQEPTEEELDANLEKEFDAEMEDASAIGEEETEESQLNG